ncbi:tonB-system energizer ExbB [Parvibaculum sp.]|uniref:tonB-system energizer ExbB n=1 Tax=Parvibaculum sp. TaxID=2024848 RepID=UPI001B053667|nr:tonB-system energizer ExbB [Parvibaculum sp.]MBO6633245.1 tonB-system energizer ExbB [Parvibaculum sp.]MBO6678029.1 tonB-system energizer ExbB [Parvibaculum sp.]MBO6683362.1 tonB-system energizer ExbB [Parvibaculum sp.]MBO6904034.1 tonB-system energizer ExbB [Parvibaculum sp.]
MTNGKTRTRRVPFLQLFLAMALAVLTVTPAAHAQDAAPAEETALEADAGADTIGTVEDGILLDAGATEAEMMLPADLSPWGMFMQADIVVKAVMIGLIFASIVTWTIWFAKRMEITGAKRRATQAFSALASAKSLDEAGSNLGKSKGPVALLAEAAIDEVHASGEAPDKEGVKERIAWRFQRIEANAAREIGIGTGVLATIGATAPFVGLFGTVWGIMNSFIGIAHTQTTNLAVVAPGIAEALLATGLGLVAAIPAVVIYNSFARSIAGYRALVADSSAELLRIVSRDLDQGRRPRLAKAAD